MPTSIAPAGEGITICSDTCRGDQAACLPCSTSQWTQYDKLGDVPSDSPLYNTLGPLYASTGSTGSVMYNDEPATSHGSSTSRDLAHAKGARCILTPYDADCANLAP